jgi:hypothetical protein
MTLANLKTKLQIIAGTDIKQVVFDWKEILNNTNKTYPVVLWSLGNARFEKDLRVTVQKTKIITVPVFAIAFFNPLTDNKITTWDTLEAQFETYLNLVDANSNLQIVNISSLKGEYIPEGVISADKEIGIMYSDVQIKAFCS